MIPETPPPHRLLTSTPTTQSLASAMLSRYITFSETHPHLHPDALITPTGVTFSSHGGPTGGVVMHNLRRVAAGLRGEYLEPEPTPDPEGEEGEGKGEGKGKWGRKEKGGKMGKKTTFDEDAEAGAEAGNEGGAVGEVEIEWQDKEVYELEQGEFEVGELGERSHVVKEGGEEPSVGVSGEKRKAGDDGKEGKLDKEARKKAKKERDAQRKKENEMKRAGKA